jgi:hypothetical protein
METLADYFGLFRYYVSVLALAYSCTFCISVVLCCPENVVGICHAEIVGTLPISEIGSFGLALRKMQWLI